MASISVSANPTTVDPSGTSSISGTYSLGVGETYTSLTITTNGGSLSNKSVSNGSFSATWTAPSTPGGRKFVLASLSYRDSSNDVQIRTDSVYINIRDSSTDVAPDVTSVTASKTSINTGESITVSATVTGSPTPSVAWSGGGSFGNSDSRRTSWSSSSSGTFTLTITATNIAGSDSGSVTVTVSASTGTAPTVTNVSATDTSITVGESITVSATVTGSPTPTVSWSGGGSFGSSSSSSSTWSASSAGSYTLTITATNSVGTDSGSVSVTVSATPPTPTVPSVTDITRSVGGAISVGQTVTLTATVTGSPTPSVQWSGSGTFGSPNSKSTTWSSSTAGDFIITCTAANSAGSGSRTIGLPVRALAAPTITSLNAYEQGGGGSPITSTTKDSTISLQAVVTGQPFPTGSWTATGGTLGNTGSGSLTPTWTATAVGSFTITVTATNSQGSASKSITITVTAPIAPSITSLTVTPTSAATGPDGRVYSSCILQTQLQYHGAAPPAEEHLPILVLRLSRNGLRAVRGHLPSKRRRQMPIVLSRKLLLSRSQLLPRRQSVICPRQDDNRTERGNYCKRNSNRSTHTINKLDEPLRFPLLRR